MATVEEDFPRGGTAKKPTGSQISVQRAEVDNLFQVEPQVFSPRIVCPFSLHIPLVFCFVLFFLNNKIWRLMQINVKEGMLMLGCVREVADFEVTVGLPCGLKGFLSVKNISDSYTKLGLNPLLKEQKQNTKILNDIFLISGSCSSQEICSLPHLFSPGMLIRCVVARLDISKGGSISIRLSVNPKLVNKSLTSSSLKAGMVLSGCVESVEDYGCIIDIGISGSKAFLPKKAIKDKHNNLEEPKVGQYVTTQVSEVKNEGRVVQLFINPTTFSEACVQATQGWNLTNLLPGLLVNCTIKKVTKHGLILDFLSSFSGQVDFLHLEAEQASNYTEGVQARVLYVEPSERLVGLTLRRFLVQSGETVEPIPADGDRIGEVVKEPNETANENRVLANPEHTCRIMDFSPMEQIHFVSLRRSIIAKPFYRYHDLQAGKIVEGTVSVLIKHGMVVHLSDHIKGLVPRNHLSDIVLKNPEKKYIEGMKVKCRVLSVDPDNKKLYLTRKKAVIESSLPLFLSYSDARPGCVSHGYIVCIKNFGCIVRFYNNVKGLVPLSELSSEPVISPGEVFYVGQVLKAKVLQCDPDKEKMVLSFKAAVEGETQEASKPQFDYELGKQVNCLEVAILPEEIQAILPTMHLSDHMSNCPMLWESLQEGDKISNLMCFNKNKQNITLTKKPLVRWSVEEGLVAKDFSEITVGMQLIGWVKNIMPYGVFVEFPYGLVGLAPKSALSEKFVKDLTAAFEVGQTVAAKVTNLDEEKRRFLITLKISDIISPVGEAQTRLINGQQERRAVAEMLATRGKNMSLLSQFWATLSVVCCMITGVNLTPGQKVTAVILHVDVLSAFVHVSVLPKLVGNKKSLNEGSKYTATVQYVDKDFAVISLDSTAQLTVIPTRSHLNEVLLFESEKLRVGMTLAVEVTERNCQDLQGLPLVSWHRTAPKRQRTVSENQQVANGHRFGEILQGKVRTVKPTCIQVTLEDGSTGSVHVSEVVDVKNLTLGSFPTSSVKPGSAVTVRVIGGREASTNRFLPISHPRFTYTIPELTLIPSKLEESVNLKAVTAKEKLNSYKVGEQVTCFVTKVPPNLIVLLFHSQVGPFFFFFFIGCLAFILCHFSVSISVQNRNLFPGSLFLSGVHKLEKGSITLGMVTNTHPQLGLLVKLPFGAMGAVALTDLADAYRPKPLDGYSKDQLIRCYLLECENNKWQLSLRPSRLNPQQAKPAKDPEVLSFGELRVGQIIRGYVKSLLLSAALITRSILSSCHFQSAALPILVLSIDKEEEFINVSLLPEDTGKPDVLPECLNLPLRLIGEEKKTHDSKMKKKRTLAQSEQVTNPQIPSDVASLLSSCFPRKSQTQLFMTIYSKQAESKVPKKKSKKTKANGNDSGIEVYFREEEDKEDKEEPKPEPAKVSPARLQVAAGFSWDVGLNSLKPVSEAQDGTSSDEEDQDRSNKKKSRHEVEQEKKAAEKALVQRETELMDPNLCPEDAAAFERLLLASPNSSLLWLQYMAHHLQATQIEQARAVAERALKTISFREEQEKLNVWVALLNLENMYGTEESLKKVFERALQFCEPMLVYQQLADIYTKSDKTKEAESLYKTMVKRFRQNKAVWLSYGTFLLQQGQSDAASTLLQRALKSLPAKESVDVIAKFAQLEFRYGDVEKGRTMFDKVLTSYPKRTDLWSVFIDLMVKHGSQKEVRVLFDRVIHLSLSVKKIKFFFKRYLEYEKKHGTPQSIQSVKEKAMEFVEAKGTEAAS
uniref:Protein RRP5 homolog n=1 Tax=Echeneis naucrates TaxID=173247 RepID=A0A665SY91_ECHNA